MVQHVIALPGSIHVDTMTHMLKTAAADVRSQLMREREARAQGSKGRGNAHLAAVMGGAIKPALAESPDYCIADIIGQDERELKVVRIRKRIPNAYVIV